MLYFKHIFHCQINKLNHVSQHSNHSSSNPYFPHIDGLRAIAIISVIIYHLNRGWMHGGFFGVDIFFVVSGFVVSAALANRDTSKISEFVWHFYSRRIRRILPALIFCLLTVAVFSVLFIPSAWLSSANQSTGYFAFFGLSNFFLAFNNGNYFSPTLEYNPFAHTWSLGVEEQFYLIFPLLFFIWIKNRNTPRTKNIAVYLFATGFLLSLATAWYLSKQSPVWGFYSLFSRFWELAAGVLLFQLSHSSSTTAKNQQNTNIARIVVLLSLVSVSYGLFSVQSLFTPFPWVIFPVAGAVGLIWGLPRCQWFLLEYLFSNPIIVFIGKISYSLYLWHWPVIVLMNWTIGLETSSQYFIAVFLTGLFAVVSYYWIELPFRYGQLKLPKPAVVMVGLAGIFIASVLSEQIYHHRERLSLSVTKNEQIWQPKLGPPPQALPNCIPKVSAKPLAHGSIHHFVNEECPRVYSHKLIVMGDSHATAYIPMLQRIAAKQGIEILLYTRGGCDFLNLYTPADKVSPICREFFQTAIANLLSHSQPGDVLFLPSLRLTRLADQWNIFLEHEVEYSMFSEATQKNRQIAVNEAIDVLKQVSKKGIKVIFEAPKPLFKSPAFRCSDWFNHMNPICQHGLSVSRQKMLDYRQPVMDSLYQIQAQLPEIRLWDPLPILCPDANCLAIKNSVPLYFDGDHISGYANELLSGNFFQQVKQLIEKQE